MPDVSRSDSQRSDSSQRPRVSFNRDVHVKRISPAGAPRVVGALSGDGAGRLVPLPVRRERPSALSRQELNREAKRVLRQADSVHCTVRDGYSTLPPLRHRRKEPGLLASVFGRSKLDKKQSSSLNDLAETEHTPSVKPKKARGLGRSLSESHKGGKPERVKVTKRKPESSGVYPSLERKKKYKVKSHSDNSDPSPSPPPRAKRHLKKSHSDSESVAVHVDAESVLGKKQLSPIIEVSPREDYFKPFFEDKKEEEEGGERMLHSSQQPPDKPPLTRGRKVESMVKRLSQDSPRRAPLRGVSPSALVSPGDDRRHNNNLPFSYTEPTPPKDQVIYAEVVVSGVGGSGPVSKQTVHTSVPALASDEDEGLDLSMERGRRGAPTYKREYEVHESSKYESGDFIIDSSARGRADGMDTRRRDYGVEVSDRYEDGLFRNDVYENSLNKSLVNDYSYKSDYQSDSKIGRDAIDKVGYYGREETITPIKREYLPSRVIDSNDLSSRRDRLESRIESQRKDRFVNTRLHETNNHKRDILESRISDSNKRFSPDAAYNNRREFLNSQLDFETDPIRDDVRYENNRNFVKSSRYVESRTEIDSHKKDLFADSGIEVDYRKDSLNNHSSYRRYDDDANIKSNDSLTAKIVVNGRQPQTQNVSRVELNGHARDRLSDDDDLDDVGKYHYRSKTDANKSTNTFASTRLVKEHRRITDVLPASTVLIRHYAPTDKEESPSPVPKPRREYRSKSQRETEKFIRVERGEASDEDYDERRRRRRNDYDDIHLGKSRDRRDEDHEEDRGYDSRRSSDNQNYSKEERGKLVTEKVKNESSSKSKLKSNEETLKKGAKKETKKKQGSTMDKMKQLFSRDSTAKKNKKKKEEKQKEEESEEDPLTSRYYEYKGRDMESDQETLRPSYRDNHSPSRRFESDHESSYRHRFDSDHDTLRRSHSPRRLDSDQETLRPSRRHTPETSYRSLPRHAATDTEDAQRRRQRERLPTPSPSPSPPRASGGWFKSLDRLTVKKKPKAKVDRDTEVIDENEETKFKPHASNGSKNLRFFGDTDVESVASIPPPPPPLSRRYKTNNNTASSSNRLQVPRTTPTSSLKNRRHHRSAGDVATSSAESTTEGDSSQQSQRSVVYLHAATVGDIPGPPQRSANRRAQSREELSSIASSHLQPQTRTISRSISVLAPWKPKHTKDGIELHYDNEDNNRNYIKNGKPPKVPVSHQTSTSSSTLNRAVRRKNAENSKNGYPQKQKVSKATSIDSLNHRSSPSGGVRKNIELKQSAKKKNGLNSATSIESLSHRSNHNGMRQHSTKERVTPKKNSSLNASAIELSNNNKSYKSSNYKKDDVKSSNKVSRSASMPKDTRVGAGWFKLRNKK